MHNKIKTLTCFIVCSLLLFSSCKKKENDDDSAVPAESYALTIDSPWQVKATVNSVHYSLSVSGSKKGYSFSGYHDGFDSVVYTYSSSLMDSTFPSHEFYIVKDGHVYPSGKSMQEQDFLKFFSVGEYSIGIQSGISIGLVDDNHVHWSSDGGSEFQGGSQFRIVDVIKISDTPNLTIKVYCRFRCWLYNDAGDSEILNNGEYVGLFRPRY